MTQRNTNCMWKSSNKTKFFEEIVNSGAYGVLTTHYGNIKVLADQTKYAENACMLFDDTKLKPLYKLKVGQPGSSYTFEVARNVGLPETIIEKSTCSPSRRPAGST